jgi:hypothetical protein
MSKKLSASYHLFMVAQQTANEDAIDALLQADGDVQIFEANAGGTITGLADNYIPDRARPSQSGVESTFVERGGDWTLPFPMLGGVGANFEPEYAAIFECCGYEKSSPGAGITEFKLATPQGPGTTIYMFRRDIDDNLMRLKVAQTARGNIAIAGTPGTELIATAVGQCITYPENGDALAFFDVATGLPALDKAGVSIAPYLGNLTRFQGPRMLCKNASCVYNSLAYPITDVSFDGALAVALQAVQTASPLACDVNLGRDGVSNANGSIVVTLCDDAAAYEDLKSAYQANEIASLVLVYEDEAGTTKITITLNIQFQATPGESPDGSVLNFDAPFIVVGDFDANPFGDNAVTIRYEAV